MEGVSKEKYIHFIGIGGIGMSGIANVLIDQGFKVSGSDMNESEVIEKLIEKGARIFLGHKKENIDNVQVVVRSTAISFENPEVISAVEQNIPVIRRAEILAELMRTKTGITVAGSHGKTTTTSILATIIQNLDLKATAVIGGIVKNIGSNAYWGNGSYVIAEADESDGSFLCLNPIMSIITNIDNDHLDFYKTKDKILQAFESFMANIPFYGKVFINAHDEHLGKIGRKLNKDYISFGVKDKKNYVLEIDYLISEIEDSEEVTTFKVTKKEESESFSLPLSGEHNILNATGAIALVHQLGFTLSEIATALKNFSGIKRRFECVYKKDNLVVIDDYGHHPTEIISTVKTAKKKYPEKELYVIFEPHRYSRTKELWSEFVNSFEDATQVYITPIYAASEKEIDNITAENLVIDINKASNNCTYLKNWDLKNLVDLSKDQNRVLLCLGAGKISRVLQDSL